MVWVNLRVWNHPSRKLRLELDSPEGGRVLGMCFQAPRARKVISRWRRDTSRGVNPMLER